MCLFVYCWVDVVGVENYGVVVVWQGVYCVQIFYEMYLFVFGELFYYCVIVDDGMVDGDWFVFVYGGFFYCLNCYDDVCVKVVWFGEINLFNYVGMIGEGGVSE